jgi:Ca-activated chloride channel homolog
MQLFRFAYPDFLYLLLLVPVILLLWIINGIRRKRALKRFGSAEVVMKLIPEASAARPVVKIIIQMLAVVLMTIVLARPQFGSKVEEVKRKGVEVIIALDVSNSMLQRISSPAAWNVQNRLFQGLWNHCRMIKLA